MQEMLTKNTTHTLTVTGMTSEGLGVGRLGQMAVFVPHAAVGDTIEVLLTKVLKTYAYGKMIRLLTPSQTRILPDCEQFPLCGGCVYRHISYEEELRIKEELVKENFYKIGHMQIPFEPILPSPLIDGYRNKAQLPVGYTKQGALTCGFYQKRSHRIIPNTSCLLQPKAFGPIEQEILLHMKEYSIPPYDEETRKGVVRHIYLRRGESTGEIMVCIVVTGKTLRKSDILVSRLRALDKNIASIVLNHNPKNTNVILGEECTTLWGKDSIEDVLCGVSVQISPPVVLPGQPPGRAKAVPKGRPVRRPYRQRNRFGPLLRRGHHRPFHGQKRQAHHRSGNHPPGGAKRPGKRQDKPNPKRAVFLRGRIRRGKPLGKRRHSPRRGGS